ILKFPSCGCIIEPLPEPMKLNPRKGIVMHNLKQVPAPVCITLMCVFVLFIVSLATAQQPAQTSPPRLVEQEETNRQKSVPPRQGQSDRQSQDSGGESIRIATEMVQLDVKVIDQNGRSVFDLAKDEFVIYEDKVKQDVEAVSSEEVPVSMGL